MRGLDIAIVVAFNVGIALWGAWFARRNRTAEHFMAAGRALPGWAVGLAIFGSFVSSISFLGGPGKSYAGNWNPFLFSLAMPVAAFIAAKVFVPFYRRQGSVSAYEHLEARFGPWARTYAVVCYILLQLARTGVVMYLLAVALQALLGWPMGRVIVMLAIVMTIYPLLGGTEAVIWIGVVQSVVLTMGAIAALAYVALHLPDGPAQLISAAAPAKKFSLGETAFLFSKPTIWVVLLYGLVENLRNFGVTQTYVQSYITARSDAAARRSVWLATGLYIPLSAVFFLIGTALWVFYQAHAQRLPGGMPADQVFPFFISTELPAGAKGLIVAAVCAAATDSNFNSVATLALCDIYKRYLSPNAGETESMAVLRTSVAFSGMASAGVALLLMLRSQSVLDAWWTLAGVFSGGILGLFLLGIFCRRAGSAAAAMGVISGTLLIGWMTLSLAGNSKLSAWLPMRSPFDPLMIPVMGTATVVLAGWLASLVWPRSTTAAPDLA